MPAMTSMTTRSASACASAGAVVDTDGDLVPDQFDNCKNVANGPNQTSNQVDTDTDGYGNACDADYNNDTLVSGLDFNEFVACFGSATAACKEKDHNGDLLISGLDFNAFVNLFGKPLTGASGLACAGTVPCTP